MRSLLHLLPFLTLVINPYAAYASCNCHQNEETKCQYFENPLIIPIFKARMNDDQKCFPKEPHSDLSVTKLIVTPRSDVFFADPEEKPKPTFSDKNINFGYLPLNENIKSIGDLLQLSSDEIAVPPKPAFKKPPPVKLWKVDDAKAFSPPELLPDVVLQQDQNKKVNINDPNVNPAIDPEHVKMGRFVVVDEPPVTRKKVGNKKQSSSKVSAYKAPAGKVPEVVLQDVVQKEDKEPDFMEQLEKIKLEAKTTVAPIEIITDDITVTATSPLPETTKGVEETETTTKTNAIKKDSAKRRESRKMEQEEKQKQEQKKEEHEDKDKGSGSQDAKKVSNTTTTTTTRFSGNEETILDELLSVV